ncbi:DUF7674 family protein [Sphingobacterium spiritivorum]|uniref:DUF7674 family protein n=1 Tax=Sphingobacterium spiritivorum TaxID=258 RepID=UPI0019195EE4|nr:hypothetical protein [Sphingobacterium spiritivorum]QQT24603.1 hypothetical protein I6J02_12680 [Sphingobacterium spiritivorum]
METKVIKTIREWLPQVIHEQISDDYTALQSLAGYFLQHIQGDEEQQAMAIEAAQIVNILYLNGKLHDKNAIENEFLSIIANEETPKSLKKHLTFFPKELRQVYLKTIIEN